MLDYNDANVISIVFFVAILTVVVFGLLIQERNRRKELMSDRMLPWMSLAMCVFGTMLIFLGYRVLSTGEYYILSNILDPFSALFLGIASLFGSASIFECWYHAPPDDD